jgi:hypothetical protein
MLDLAGCWTLSGESGAHVIAFDLPGDGISALVKAGVIPDPYRGRNGYDCRRVAERHWVARRSFMHDGTAVVDAAVPVLTLAPDALGPGDVLAFTWCSDAQGGDVHAPKPWKAYDLQPSGLRAGIAREGDFWKFTMMVKALAHFVAVESEVHGCFSTNAVTLFPGHPATITFTPGDPSAVPVFTLRDLHSATYGG